MGNFYYHARSHRYVSIEVASSPIRINEATAEQLQTLRGIGPKRAAYIEQYRNEVAPLLNTFDLAAATGISLKAASEIAPMVTWDQQYDQNRISTGPVIVTTLISMILLLTGFERITDSPFVAPNSYLILSLALILLGGITASGDIAVAAIRQQPSETSWIFSFAVLLAGAGFGILALLLIASPWADYPAPFTENLNQLGSFMGLGLLIAGALYGPSVCLRFMTEEARVKGLPAAIKLFDLILIAIALIAISGVIFSVEKWGVTTVFAFWCLAFLGQSGFDMIRGTPGFINLLPKLDQGRIRFIARQHQVVLTYERVGYCGWSLLAALTVLIILGVAKVWSN